LLTFLKIDAKKLAPAKKAASECKFKSKIFIGRRELMNKNELKTLSRREQQIMDIIYSRGQATATEVMENLPDPPSYSAVRALLRVLEEKGHLRHKQDGQRYVYSPTVARERAKRSALRRVLQTFFDDSTEDAVAALLDISQERLSDDELKRMEELIKQARMEGR
jgi:predicted transcriptional regulator